MKQALWLIAGFALYYIGFKNFEAIMLFFNKWVHYGLAGYFWAYVAVGIPIFAAVCIINKGYNFPAYLGLNGNIGIAFIASLIFAAPLLLGGFIFFGLKPVTSVPNLIAQTLFAGFFEELYFRGFFFGQLFRKTKLGFLPSILVCSLIFAAGHLYQSHDAGTLFGVFITTFMGSVLFAWLFAEWEFNLWVPIILHTLMNLAWELFAMSENAFGNMSANILRGITIALSIILTLVYKKRTGRKLAVNRHTLLLKPAAKPLQ
ncbi:CPBP family intramembrane glutamic endopeptidase [Mucilaginibacter pedocola]|nr:CPBP family intramembrane glutamic endopeptidase [Mucilaginibacter pedocola]